MRLWEGVAVPTIYDVAKEAGVSPKTVSRVINGESPVGKKTRAAVERAMGALDYSPSFAARTMRSNRSGLVGVITGAVSHFTSKGGHGGLPDMILVQAIQRAIALSGKTLMIADTSGSDDRIAPLAQTFRQYRVDGLIYVADYHQEVVLPKFDRDCPLVLANCFDAEATPAVVPDDRQDQRALVEALIARGHRRIGFLTLAPELVATRERTLGYADALSAAGIAYDPAIVLPGYLDTPDDDIAQLRAAMSHMLDLPDRPTVLCCGNDAMAMRIYGLLRTRGLKVPEDVSVAGHDDDRTIAEVLYPPLTTVELPYGAIGTHAAEMLLSLMGGGEAATLSPADGPASIAGRVRWRESVTTKDTS